MFKMKDRGSFVAHAADGTPYTIKWQQRLEHVNGEWRVARDELWTEFGGRVNRIGEGKFLVSLLGIEVFSDDPNVPDVL